MNLVLYEGGERARRENTYFYVKINISYLYVNKSKYLYVNKTKYIHMYTTKETNLALSMHFFGLFLVTVGI